MYKLKKHCDICPKEVIHAKNQILYEERRDLPWRQKPPEKTQTDSSSHPSTEVPSPESSTMNNFQEVKIWDSLEDILIEF